jgi:hypothetical protein
MITSYIIGIAGMITLMVLWVVVQRHWKKIFSEQLSDEDVLAGRSDCGNCRCANNCENKPQNIR